MKKQLKVLLLLMLTFIFLPGISQNDELLNILKEELQYEFDELQSKEHPPYYMAFRANDSYFTSVVSTNGSITNVSENLSKSFAPEIRIGNYDFDNTHIYDNDMYVDNSFYYCMLPKENNTDLVKYKIWETTEILYKNTVDEYLAKKEKLDTSDINLFGDFTKQSPEKYFEPKLSFDDYKIDVDYWKEKLNKYTSIFKNTPEIFMVTCEFSYKIDRQYFVSTENTEITENQELCAISLFAVGKSLEGEFIPYSEVHYAFTPDRLPHDSIIIAGLIDLREQIITLSKATKAEPFSGPAILSAKAAGVFFHEILGHRIEGHRMELSFNSKTFKSKINKLVLNKELSVYSDPTAVEYEGQELIGHYKYDNQGVKAQKVINIQDGVLNDFLMSRKPITDIDQSNGHGRGNLNYAPVSRQSNLFVTTTKPKSFSYLKKKLIKECKKQGVEYGYYFKKVSGGFTNTMNFSPDFFNIIPLEVYRIYVDGRPDELVRGVNLIGTPLTIFSEIIASGDENRVFSGICGAESGNIPVSAIAPSILIRKIETQNQFIFKPEWPVLPDPESLIKN